jgi:hypothetical protein
LVVPKAGAGVDMDDCPKTEPDDPSGLVLPNADAVWGVWPKTEGFGWVGLRGLDPNVEPVPPEPNAEVLLPDPNAEPVVDPNAPKPEPVAAGGCPKGLGVIVEAGWVDVVVAF